MTQEPLPKGWCWTRLDELLAEPLRNGRSARASAGGKVRCLTLTAVTEGDFSERHTKLTSLAPGEVGDLWLRPGDILVERSNTPELVGTARLYTGAPGLAIFPDLVIRLRTVESISRRFVELALQSDRARRYFQRSARGIAGSMPKISQEIIEGFRVPIPSRPEQERMVAVIDSYYSRLDDAASSLRRVRANLKRYRASVLKAAVEGRLVATEAELARREGRDYEPASALLARILAERRRRWEEAELARLKAKGKPPKDDRWKEKYKELAAPDTMGLPDLPEGWCWATVDQVGDVTGGITKNANRSGMRRQLPYLRVANVYADDLRLDDVAKIGVSDSELERTLLKKEDLLVVEGNGSADQIGRVALWDGSVDPCVHQNHLIKVRFTDGSMARWALHWLLSSPGRRKVERMASSTSGLHTLSLSKVAHLPIPVPPRDEQVRAIREVDSRISVAQQAQEALSDSVTRCERLRQAILRWAFEGKLVDQDPNDEPASAILERIRAERAAAREIVSARPGRKPGRAKVSAA